MPWAERDVSRSLAAQLKVTAYQIDYFCRLANLFLNIEGHCRRHQRLLWQQGLREVPSAATDGVSLPCLPPLMGKPTEAHFLRRRAIIILLPQRVNIAIGRLPKAFVGPFRPIFDQSPGGRDGDLESRRTTSRGIGSILG